MSAHPATVEGQRQRVVLAATVLLGAVVTAWALRIEPGDLALGASRRVEAALDACGPRLRPIVGRICIAGDSLQLAETGLGLRRRQGKTLLKQGLQALAEHYRL